MDSVLVIIFELLKVLVLPAAIIYSAMLLVKKYIEFNQNRRNFELRKNATSEVFPKQLQAYERMILYLERITPGSIVMRIHQPGMSSKLLQTELVKSIREEYEHNLAQQVYMPHETWSMIKKTKDEMVHLINVSAGQIENGSTGMELAQMIFKLSAELGKLPTEKTIVHLKREIQQFF